MTTEFDLKEMLQYPPNEFIQVIVHEIREDVIAIDTWIKLVYENTDIATTNLAKLESGRNITVREGCEAMLKRKDRLIRLLDLAFDYAKFHRATGGKK
jgi:hypothetical protein